MATDFSLESVRQYMLAHEGKVTNHDLVKYYKAWLTHPVEKDSARQRFKEYVNTLSTIKIENGIKFLVLKKRFYPSFAIEPTPQNMAALPPMMTSSTHHGLGIQSGAGSSPSLLDEVMSTYQTQYHRPSRQLPQLPPPNSHHPPPSVIPPSYRQPPQPPPSYRQPPPPPPPTAAVQPQHYVPPDLGLPLPSDYGLPTPRQGLFHPPGPTSLTNYEMRTSPPQQQQVHSQQHHPPYYAPPNLPPAAVQQHHHHQQHQSQGSPQHQYHSQMPPYSSRNIKPPETHAPAVGVGPAPPQMSRSSSVMSSYHSSYELGSSRSVSVSSSRPSLHETDSTPPPPLPTRNNVQQQQQNQIQNKEPSPPLSMASSSTSSRKASLSEDKENQEMLEAKAKQEKISVKERTKTFNRMASEVDVTNLLKVANNVSSTNNNIPNDKKRKNSRANRGSSSHRDDLDSHDSSSISTLDHVSKQWMVTAAKCDYISLVKMLREDPRLAKAKDFITGYTALHWAAKHGNLDLVKLLAGQYQVDVNVKSHGGYTPLHLSCQFSHQEVFDILVKAYGADPNLRDNAGKKPRQYMQLTAVSSGAQGGFHMSNDTFRQLKDRRRNRNRQLADKNSGILRFGSLSVKVKKTTEAFNNYFGHNDKKSSTGDQPYSLPMIGVGPDEDTAKMPPPPKKLGSIKKRKSKRAADFHQAVAISKSAPVTPQGPSPIKEEKHSDSDSEYGFDSQWAPS